MPDLFHNLELLSLVAFAISGAGAGMGKRYDVFGVFVIAFVTSIGGGTLRDLFLGNLPVSWMKNLTYVYIILGSTLFAMLLQKTVEYLRDTLFLFDSLGLGIFTILGIEHGLNYGFDPVISILLGTITASFGGVLRDILCQEKPVIFRKEIYASTCILGGVLFFALKSCRVDQDYIYAITILTVFFMRIIAVRYHLSFPSMYPSRKKKPSKRRKYPID